MEHQNQVQDFNDIIQEGKIWDDIKHYYVLDEIPPEQQKAKMKKMQGFVELREVIDFQIYREAVEKLFPVAHYNLEAKINGDIRTKNSQPIYATEWYEFRISPRPNIKPTSNQPESQCIIRINAPGSRTLTSDIDTSILAEVKGESFNFEFAHERIRNNGPDYEGSIAVAMIDEFYRISESQFKVTSSQHRDSNAYIDLIAYEAEHYPKFKSMDSSNPTIGKSKIFSEEEFAKFFSSYKKEKHQLELAASFFLLRLVIKDHQHWQKFSEELITILMNELNENLSNNPKLEKYQKMAHDDIAKIFEEVETLYALYQEELYGNAEKNTKGKIKEIEESEYGKQSPLKEKAKKERDFLVAALNRLYVKYLSKMVENNNEILALQQENKQFQLEAETNYRLWIKQQKILDDQKCKPDLYEKEDVDRQEKKVADLGSSYNEKATKLKGNIKKIAKLEIEKLRYRVQAHLFANEAYTNRSAVYHVVKGMQQGKDTKITEQTLLGSVLQQIGFKLLHTEELKSQGKSDEEVMYLTSKYGQRIHHLLIGVSSNAALDNNKITRPGRGNTLEILQCLKSAKLKPHFYQGFADNQAALLLINQDTRIVTNVKKNEKIADNKKITKTKKLINNAKYKLNITEEQEKEAYLKLASQVLAQVYSSKLERAGHVWDVIQVKVANQDESTASNTNVQPKAGLAANVSAQDKYAPKSSISPLLPQNASSPVLQPGMNYQSQGKAKAGKSVHRIQESATIGIQKQGDAEAVSGDIMDEQTQGQGNQQNFTQGK